MAPPGPARRHGSACSLLSEPRDSRTRAAQAADPPGSCWADPGSAPLTKHGSTPKQVGSQVWGRRPAFPAVGGGEPGGRRAGPAWARQRDPTSRKIKLIVANERNLPVTRVSLRTRHVLTRACEAPSDLGPRSPLNPPAPPSILFHPQWSLTFLQPESKLPQGLCTCCFPRPPLTPGHLYSKACLGCNLLSATGWAGSGPFPG